MHTQALTSFTAKSVLNISNLLKSTVEINITPASQAHV
jgi:hypothetical protein